jgi:hypothetical protein
MLFVGVICGLGLRDGSVLSTCLLAVSLVMLMLTSLGLSGGLGSVAWLSLPITCALWFSSSLISITLTVAVATVMP